MKNRPKFCVDFNEMLESNLVLFAADDIKVDSTGESVALFEGLEVIIYAEDTNDDGKPEDLIAMGYLEKNDMSVSWASNAKWCCRIDNNGIWHESEYPNPL